MAKTVAIIPARGGSKGIPRKNIVDLAGKPLIAHSILQAKSSKHIDRVIVSTEDAEIAAVAKSFGAEIIDRPKTLTEDHVLDLPVFEHALNFLKEHDRYDADFVVHLRPTAPYRKTSWIDDCLSLLQKNSQADSVRSVSSVIQHPYRVFEIGSDGFLEAIMKDRHQTPYLLRRQDLPPMYFYNCVIDVTKPSTIFGKQSMTGDRMLPFVMKEDEVFDIDTKQDLEWARYFLGKML